MSSLFFLSVIWWFTRTISFGIILKDFNFSKWKSISSLSFPLLVFMLTLWRQSNMGSFIKNAQKIRKQCEWDDFSPVPFSGCYVAECKSTEEPFYFWLCLHKKAWKYRPTSFAVSAEAVNQPISPIYLFPERTNASCPFNVSFVWRNSHAPPVTPTLHLPAELALPWDISLSLCPQTFFFFLECDVFSGTVRGQCGYGSRHGFSRLLGSTSPPGTLSPAQLPARHSLPRCSCSWAPTRSLLAGFLLIVQPRQLSKGLLNGATLSPSGWHKEMCWVWLSWKRLFPCLLGYLHKAHGLFIRKVLRLVGTVN